MARGIALAGVGLLGLLIGGCGSNGSGTKLTGAGASFPAPLYIKWFSDYKEAHPDVTVDYQSTGSGQGVKSIIDGTVDFGASDAAMTKDEMAKVERGVVLLPMTAGKVVLAYNLDGVSDLKLSREAYAGIFLGNIKKWNDPAIAKHNPGVSLPDKAINVIVRADSSGTTYAFTNHLSAINSEFAKKPGVNKMPEWPVGTKSKGNEGVTASIKNTPASIGYIEYGFAKSTELPMAVLENKEGQFIAPTAAAGKAALASAAMPDDLIAWIPDPSGKESYPIVTYTWLIAYKKYDDEKKRDTLKAVVGYCLEKGQASSEELGYIPLPEAVVAKVKSALDQIK